VFLNALIAAPGRSFIEQVGDEPEMLVPGDQTGIGDRMTQSQTSSRPGSFGCRRERVSSYGSLSARAGRWLRSIGQRATLRSGSRPQGDGERCSRAS
jgi:hypothetical protein